MTNPKNGQTSDSNTSAQAVRYSGFVRSPGQATLGRFLDQEDHFVHLRGHEEKPSIVLSASSPIFADSLLYPWELLATW